MFLFEPVWLSFDSLKVIRLVIVGFFKLFTSERLCAFKLIAYQFVFDFSAPVAFGFSAPFEVIMLLYSVRGSCRGLGPCQYLPEILGALSS